MKKSTQLIAGCLSALTLVNTMAPMIAAPVYAMPDVSDKMTQEGNENTAIYTASFYFSRIVENKKSSSLEEVSIPIDVGVSSNDILSAPNIPDVEGYEFIGWDKVIPEHITEDTEFHAVYKEAKNINKEEISSSHAVTEISNEKEKKNTAANQNADTGKNKYLTEGVFMTNEDYAKYLEKINNADINCEELKKEPKNQVKTTTVVVSDLFDIAPEDFSEEIINDSKAQMEKSLKNTEFLPFRSFIIPYLAGHSGEIDNPLVPYLWCRVFNEEKNWKKEGKWSDTYGTTFTDKDGVSVTTTGQPIACNPQYDKYLAKDMSISEKEFPAHKVSLFNAMYSECPDVLAGYLKDYKNHPEVTEAVIEYFNKNDIEVFNYDNNDVGLYLINIWSHNYNKLSKDRKQYFKEKVLPVAAYAYLQSDKRVIISKEETPEVYDLVARSRFVMTPTYDKYSDLLFLNKRDKNPVSKQIHDQFQQEFFNYVVNSEKGLGDWIYQTWTHDYYDLPDTIKSYKDSVKIKTLYKRFDSASLGKDPDRHNVDLAFADKDFMHKLQTIEDFTKVSNYSMYNGEKGAEEARKNLILMSICYQDKSSDGWDIMDMINANPTFKSAFDNWYKAELDYYKVAINYNLDGGDNSTANPTEFTLFDLFELAPAAKKGYTFDGWYLDSNFNNRILGNNVVGWTRYEGKDSIKLDSICKSKENNITVYAKFIANSYKVTIDANGGATTTNVEALKCDQTVEISPPTRTGYKFSGWEIKGGGASIKDNIFKQGYENSVIKAKWTPNTYKLTINANGGSCSTGTQNVNYDKAVTINNPTRTGYAFTGWTVNGTGAKLNGSTFMIGLSDATLTANWKPNTYVITLNYNGGVKNGADRITVTYDTNVTLPSPSKNYDDNYYYTFNGWNYGGNNYKGTFKYTIAGNVTMTASWQNHNHVWGNWYISRNPVVSNQGILLQDGELERKCQVTGAVQRKALGSFIYARWEKEADNVCWTYGTHEWGNFREQGYHYTGWICPEVHTDSSRYVWAYRHYNPSTGKHGYSFSTSIPGWNGEGRLYVYRSDVRL